MESTYALTNEMLQLLDMIQEDGEDEVLRDTFEALAGERNIKFENCIKAIRNYEGKIKNYKEEIADFKNKVTIAENTISRIKNLMKFSMEATGDKKIDTGLFTVSIANNGGKLPLLVAENINAGELPMEYVTFPAPVVNRDAVYKALEEGTELEWAHLGERGTSLRIK